MVFEPLLTSQTGNCVSAHEMTKTFQMKYPLITTALGNPPDETVIDGEIVALDEGGRPSFNALQNYGSTAAGANLFYYVFDVMVISGLDIMREPLARRQKILAEKVSRKLVEPVRLTWESDGRISELIPVLKKHGLEGIVAKRRNSPYEPGLRSGAWRKMRVNRSQDFVIGGYTVGNPFDALVFGYYEGKHLMYAARTGNGFSPASRVALFEKFRGFEIPNCPFVNLPELRSGRWGQGPTKEKNSRLPVGKTSSRRSF